MDPRIEGLKSTTFFGRKPSRRKIAQTQETVEQPPGNSRGELARAICEHLNWRTPGGGHREQFALRGAGEPRCARHPETAREAQAERRISQAGRARGAIGPGPDIACDLAELEPIALEPAIDKAAAAEWTELVDRHIYLGCASPIGLHLRYFVVDASGRRLGGQVFEASGAPACRDEWIGWTKKQRDRRPTGSRTSFPPACRREARSRRARTGCGA